MPGPPRPPFLERLGLHRPELRAWALYDWANSAMVTVVITTVFPIFFESVSMPGAAEDAPSRRLAGATAIALAVAAVLGPVLGAAADLRPRKKRFLGAFQALAVAATAGLAFVARGDWPTAAVLFGLANVGAAAAFVFYDALLPHIASHDEMDRVSSAGYALGYVGGGISLVLVAGGLLFRDRLGIDDPAVVMRASFLLVAVWWALFSVPLFRRVPEPPVALEPDEAPDPPVLRTALRRLRETFLELRGYRQAFLMLLAFLLFNDGILTIIRMAVIYGKAMDFGAADLVGAILVTQFVGVPCAFGFGALAHRIGAKRSILIALAAYVVISCFAYFVSKPWHFWALAIAVGTVQGGAQALSRSLFASMIPRHKASEFFGLFAVAEKFAGIFGPALVFAAVTLTGSNRATVVTVLPFFLVGGWLLTRVDVEAGRRAARAADAPTRST